MMVGQGPWQGELSGAPVRASVHGPTPYAAVNAARLKMPASTRP